MNNRQSWVRPLNLPRWLIVSSSVGLIAIIAVVPLIATPFFNFTISMILTFAVVGMGLNLLTGYTGQISIGHNAFVAFGAYTTAAIAQQHLNLLFAFPLAAIICFIVGFVLGLPSLRMGGLQFALVTLALALVVPAVIKRIGFLTGGAEGITINVEAPAWTGLATDQWVYYVCLVVALVGMLVFLRISAGRIGRSLIAIRDYEGVAKSNGVRTSIIKTQVFAISGAYAGVAGVLYALAVQYVGPDSFGLAMAISFITMIVIGGLSTATGALLGAVFIQMVPQLTAGMGPAVVGSAYGVTLIVFIFFMPFGLVGLIRKFGHWLRERTVRPPQMDELPQSKSKNMLIESESGIKNDWSS